MPTYNDANRPHFMIHLLHKSDDMDIEYFVLLFSSRKKKRFVGVSDSTQNVHPTLKRDKTKNRPIGSCFTEVYKNIVIILCDQRKINKIVSHLSTKKKQKFVVLILI